MPGVMKVYRRTISETGESKLGKMEKLYTHNGDGEPLVTILFLPGTKVDNRKDYSKRIGNIAGTIKYTEFFLTGKEDGKEIHNNPRLQFLGIYYDNWHNRKFDIEGFNKKPESYYYNESYAMSKFLAPLYAETVQDTIVDRLPLEEAMERMGHLVVCGVSAGGVFGLEVDNAITDRMRGLGYNEDEIDKILQRKHSLFLGNTANPRFARSTNIFAMNKKDEVSRMRIPDFDELIGNDSDYLTVSKIAKNSLIISSDISDEELLRKTQPNKTPSTTDDHHHPDLFVYGDNVLSYMAKNILRNIVKNSLAGKTPQNPTDLLKNTSPMADNNKDTDINHVYTEAIKTALAADQIRGK